MTLIDYLLLAGFGAAAVYTVSRLFMGWRNSVFTHDENEKMAVSVSRNALWCNPVSDNGH